MANERFTFFSRFRLNIHHIIILLEADTSGRIENDVFWIEFLYANPALLLISHLCPSRYKYSCLKSKHFILEDQTFNNIQQSHHSEAVLYDCPTPCMVNHDLTFDFAEERWAGPRRHEYKGPGPIYKSSLLEQLAGEPQEQREQQEQPRRQYQLIKQELRRLISQQ